MCSFMRDRVWGSKSGWCRNCGKDRKWDAQVAVDQAESRLQRRLLVSEVATRRSGVGGGVNWSSGR